MKKLLTLIGTRPEIIKVSPLLPSFDQCFDHKLVHSGQHYSRNMDQVFFNDLGLRQPDYFLEVGSQPPAKQVGLIMSKFEEILLQFKPDAVLVQGDTNTTLAGGLTAAKHRASGLKLIHIEAVARSHNLNQPEELNRRVVDSFSDLMFAIDSADLANADHEGIDRSKVVMSGNTVYDCCVRIAGRIDSKAIVQKFGVQAGKYLLLTAHRQETTENASRLRALVESVNQVGEVFPIVFPIHPRTKAKAAELGLEFKAKYLICIEPIGYVEMVALLKESKFVLTDSGGLMEEAAILRIPSLILRSEIEQPKFISSAMHVLCPPIDFGIRDEALGLLSSERELEKRRNSVIEFETRTSEIILEAIKKMLTGS